MIGLKINSERAGRIIKPAKSIDLYDEEEKYLASISFSEGYRNSPPTIRVTQDHTERAVIVIIQTDPRTTGPELVRSSWRGGFPGGIWRFDPYASTEKRAENEAELIASITSKPVKLIAYYLTHDKAQSIDEEDLKEEVEKE